YPTPLPQGGVADPITPVTNSSCVHARRGTMKRAIEVRMMAGARRQVMARAATLKRSIVLALVSACGSLATTTAAQTATTTYTVRTLPLPDRGTGDVSMDYIAFDPATNNLWVPGGNTGAVDVVDVATGTVRQIPNLPTSEVPARGRTRVLGPS